MKFVLELQVRVGLLGKKLGQALLERVGVHVGEVLVEVPEGAARMQGLNGIHVDICQAVLSVAGPGQVLLTRFDHDSARQALRQPSGSGAAELAWSNHGAYHIEGTDEAVEHCEVADRSRMPLRPPKGNERVRRAAGEPDLTELAPDISEATFFQRLRIAQVALVVNCKPHDVPALVTARLLNPLGDPQPNSVKFFATVEVLELAEDRPKLAKLT